MTSLIALIPGAVIYHFTICLLVAGGLANQAHGQVEWPCYTTRPIIAKGQNTTPTGELKIKTYRLETSDKKLFCLSVTLGSHISGTNLIWINDDPVAAYYLRRGELTASLPLDRLEEGAAISVSQYSTPYDLTTLPEKLHLPHSLIRLRQALPTVWTKLTDILRVTRNVDGAAKTFIAIEITSSAEFPLSASANTWVIQIGRKEFSAWVDRNARKLNCIMTPEQFAELEDGDLVRVNWGYGALRYGSAGKSFAKLDKGMIDKAK